MCPSVSRPQSVCRVIQEGFCEACIEACVDDVCDDVRSLASRPYHVTDSGNGSRVWCAIRNIRGSETQWIPPSDVVDFGFYCTFVCKNKKPPETHHFGKVVIFN